MENLEFELPELDPKEVKAAQEIAKKDIQEDNGIPRRSGRIRQTDETTYNFDESIEKLGKKISK